MKKAIVGVRNNYQFLQELETAANRYCQMALDKGATDALVADASIIGVHERVQMKCFSPRCRNLSQCANCPPHFMPSMDWCRSLIESFRLAVFFRITFPANLAVGKRTREQREELGRITSLLNEIVALIEAEAYYDGYYLALGIGGGSCKSLLCPDKPCLALTGQPCRHPLRSRVTGEGLGIDYLGTAARLGWDIYSLGFSSDPKTTPCANRVGFVLID